MCRSTKLVLGLYNAYETLGLTIVCWAIPPTSPDLPWPTQGSAIQWKTCDLSDLLSSKIANKTNTMPNDWAKQLWMITKSEWDEAPCHILYIYWAFKDTTDIRAICDIIGMIYHISRIISWLRLVFGSRAMLARLVQREEWSNSRVGPPGIVHPRQARRNRKDVGYESRDLTDHVTRWPVRGSEDQLEHGRCHQSLVAYAHSSRRSELEHAHGGAIADGCSL